VWQVFALIFVVNACAAGYTPAFQATIPEVLPEEHEYTRALSFSRLAYDLSELLSPVAAAVLLLVMDFHGLFALNAVAFLAAAGLVASVSLPHTGRDAPVSDRTWARITVGARRYLTTPRLRALLALNLAVACASAMTIVNTVVLVRDDLGLGDSAVAIALGAAGAGSAITALLVPAIIDRLNVRTVMLSGGVLLATGLPLIALGPSYPPLLALWLVLGIGLSLVQTPAGLLIQRSADDATRPALFAAQFSLSHACWLLTYPVAGIVGAAVGLDAVAIGLGAVAAASTASAGVLWKGDAP
jgi:MFS family permease